MKFYIFLSVLIASIVIIQCSHTFMGTNVFRQRVYHREVRYGSKIFQKRVENLTYSIPSSFGYGRSIQGILAYDLSNSGATANVTAGGLGYGYVTLRMKSDRGRQLHYDVHIYA